MLDRYISVHEEGEMFRNLVMDATAHLRECILINVSLVVALALGAAYLKTAGKKADHRIRAFYICSILASAAVLCPITNAIFRIITGTYYDAPDMWTVVPLIPLGAIMCSALAGEIAAGLFSNKEDAPVKPEITEEGDAVKDGITKGDTAKEDTVKRASIKGIRINASLGAVLVAAAILVCGSLGRPCEQTSGRPENSCEIERVIAEMVYEKKLLGGAEQVILAPDDMIAYLHTCSGNAITLYGRDMWDGRLTKNRYGQYSPELISIHDDMLRIMAGENVAAGDLCRRAFEQGATVVILPIGGYDGSSIVEAGYEILNFSTSADEENPLPGYILVTKDGFFLTSR